jgi:hypothetical protein
MKRASRGYGVIGVGKKPELQGPIMEGKPMSQIRGREQLGTECGGWSSKHSSLMHADRRLFRLGAGCMREVTRPGHVILCFNVGSDVAAHKPVAGRNLVRTFPYSF